MPKGEFVMVLFPAEQSSDGERVETDPAELALEFGRITESGVLSRRDAIRQVARKFGVAARDVFDAIERHRNSTE
jgi:hypothetical protein